MLAKQVRGRLDQADEEIKKGDYKKAKRYLVDTDKDEKMMRSNLLEIYTRTAKVKKLKSQASKLGVDLRSRSDDEGASAVNF